MHEVRVRWLAVPVASLAVLVGSGAMPGQARPARAIGEPPPRHAGEVVHEVAGAMFHRVLEGARKRLAEPRCQKVLDDFHDVDGRTLREHLAESGRTLEDHLGLVVFYDGRRQPPCGLRRTLGFANVGSRVVWLCPEQFELLAFRDPLWAEATVIHEALHTLGLGEDPPLDREITLQVLRRCRR